MQIIRSTQYTVRAANLRYPREFFDNDIHEGHEGALSFFSSCIFVPFVDHFLRPSVDSFLTLLVVASGHLT